MLYGILQKFAENDTHIKGLIGVQPNLIFNARNNHSNLLASLMDIIKYKSAVYRFLLLVMNDIQRIYT